MGHGNRYGYQRLRDLATWFMTLSIIELWSRWLSGIPLIGPHCEF